ncbi:MAG: hypothetical protein PHY05_03595 [Methanothrix sp.]|nr:hypothetical protein [Methanothrix sp.]
MNKQALTLSLIIFVALTSNAIAVHWSSSIHTVSNHWSIYREGGNISFGLSSLVDGRTSPVESRGRILRPYQACYEEVGTNDVRLRQRTSSLEGRYKASDEIKMQSAVYPDEIEIIVDKPAGSELFTIEYKNEIWPVALTASRTIDYSGQQINTRYFEENSGDFIGTSFLYNHELSTQQRSVIWLKRMNATVLATNDAILLAEFKPTKYIGSLMRANSTGISDLSYRLRSSQYDFKHQSYPVLSEEEERYYGTYDLARKIEMRSLFENSNDTHDEYSDAYYVANNWLPCCSGGYFSMAPVDQKTLKSAKSVFDCTCNTFAGYQEKVTRT